jgi:ribose 5-phosphate isomerase RpiB
MSVLCLGRNVVGAQLALELIESFLTAHFSGAARHRRRLAEVRALAHQEP